MAESIPDTSVEVGKCVLCGEPVYSTHVAKDISFLEEAGEIKIEFSYGSCRDTDHGVGYIHDVCSAKLEKLLKHRLDWSSSVDCSMRINLEKTITENKVIYDSLETPETTISRSINHGN